MIGKAKIILKLYLILKVMRMEVKLLLKILHLVILLSLQS